MKFVLPYGIPFQYRSVDGEACKEEVIDDAQYIKHYYSVITIYDYNTPQHCTLVRSLVERGVHRIRRCPLYTYDFSVTLYMVSPDSVAITELT